MKRVSEEMTPKIVVALKLAQKAIDECLSAFEPCPMSTEDETHKLPTLHCRLHLYHLGPCEFGEMHLTPAINAGEIVVAESVLNALCEECGHQRRDHRYLENHWICDAEDDEDDLCSCAAWLGNPEG
jgi:hypothetical protein